MKFLTLYLLAAATMLGQDAPPPPTAPTPPKRAPRPPKPGVSTPGVKREMAAIKPDTIFPIEGTPDWQVLTEDSVWVSNGPKNTVHRINAKTNQLVAAVAVGRRPCSGLAEGFGSVWVPNCGDKTVSRIDSKTNEVVATVAVGPAVSEGGIAASPQGIWLVTDAKGILSRIDPATNKVVAEVAITPNSAACIYADGAVWVTTPEKNLLTRVDPKTNTVTQTVEVGKGPRFLTAGAGSIWTLNQGDGTVSRVDSKTVKLIANIEAGIPGNGGEIAFGEGHVWATVPQIPLSEIDPAKNEVIKQWVGPGGDSVRVGHGSVWLSNLSQQNVWRFSPNQQ